MRCVCTVRGKLVGITLASWIATKSGLARLPTGGSWREISGVAAVAGIGFTVSLFVAQLAFPEGPLLRAAKLGVLVSSALAGMLGVVLLQAASRRRNT